LTGRNVRGSSRAVRPNESPFSAADAPASKPASTKRRAKGAKGERSVPDKREKILRAAVKVFARKGFYATRVSEIAKAAGVADGTIYLYFENKDDVLISVFEDRITRLLVVLREEIAKSSGFEDGFRRIVELQLGLLDGQRDLAEVITVNLRQSSKLLKQYATPLFTQYLELIAALVAEGQREGVVRPDLNPRIVARSLWGALDGVAVTWAIGGGETGQLAKAAIQVGDVFLAGLVGDAGVRPARAERATPAALASRKDPATKA
jgi:TetR/AcrR family fatty acid metabolism transcriptional regulator